jgi:hypothetical protein
MNQRVSLRVYMHNATLINSSNTHTSFDFVSTGTVSVGNDSTQVKEHLNVVA